MTRFRRVIDATYKVHFDGYNLNIRMGPFERAAVEWAGYQAWLAESMYTFAPAEAYVA